MKSEDEKQVIAIINCLAMLPDEILRFFCKTLVQTESRVIPALAVELVRNDPFYRAMFELGADVIEVIERQTKDEIKGTFDGPTPHLPRAPFIGPGMPQGEVLGFGTRHTGKPDCACIVCAQGPLQLTPDEVSESEDEKIPKGH